MDITTDGNTLIICGVLDEKASADQLFETIKGVAERLSEDRIRVDLSGVSRCNSTGIWTWLKTLKELGRPPVTYVHCPPWLVDQFNMLKEFFRGDVVVESLQVPYYSEDDDEMYIKEMRLGQDVPIQASYASFDQEKIEVDGREFEIAVDPEVFFAFVSRL